MSMSEGVVNLDFTRCRKVWVPETPDAEGFWSPPPRHVEVGVEWICRLPYMLLADDMGGMKTAQAIIAAQFLHDANVIDRVVVIAPSPIRSKVWFDQDLGQLYEQTFDDKLNFVTEYHAKMKRWVRGPSSARELRWIVTNYEFIRSAANLAVLMPYCGSKTLLILDESSAVRGYKSAQTDACMKLRWLTDRKGRPQMGYPRCGRIVELNGTPVAESPMDMFSQGNLLHPSILDCKYVTHYKARYALEEVVRRSDGKAMTNPRSGEPLKTIAGWSKEGIEDIQRRFKPYILRREAKDFGVDFALPPVALEVTLTTATWKHYVSMRDQMVVWLESGGGVVAAQQAGVKSLRLSQITSGFLGGVEDPGIDDFQVDAGSPLSDHWDLIDTGITRTAVTYGTVQEIGREKLDFAIGWHAELLRRYPELKLLTWCRFVPELKRYLRELRLTFPSIPVGAACGEKIFDGEHNKKDEREFALRLLHPKSAPIGAATVGATQGTGAMGLNFTACRTVLDMSFDFSPWKKKQGDARVNRTGQTGPVSFFYLIAVGPKGQKTIDHHVLMHRTGKANINDWTTSAWVRALKEE